ncbi:MAG: ATP-dependent DNA ligase [Verrucomicrobia bacterium]|nr:ATP-dependent DNA ligase [Verrucomicrobiota bacterium]
MSQADGRFVVQEHHARTHHFDFRLEKDGVFKSWAVPKGLPDRPGVRHLAVQVEDHKLDFGDFEGTIPEGQYGAGDIHIWDRGTYDIHEWRDDHIRITLHGARAQGTLVLIPFRHGRPREWLLWKVQER